MFDVDELTGVHLIENLHFDLVEVLFKHVGIQVLEWGVFHSDGRPCIELFNRFVDVGLHEGSYFLVESQIWFGIKVIVALVHIVEFCCICRFYVVFRFLFLWIQIYIVDLGIISIFAWILMLILKIEVIVVGVLKFRVRIWGVQLMGFIWVSYVYLIILIFTIAVFMEQEGVLFLSEIFVAFERVGTWRGSVGFIDSGVVERVLIVAVVEVKIDFVFLAFVLQEVILVYIHRICNTSETFLFQTKIV